MWLTGWWAHAAAPCSWPGGAACGGEGCPGNRDVMHPAHARSGAPAWAWTNMSWVGDGNNRPFLYAGAGVSLPTSFHLRPHDYALGLGRRSAQGGGTLNQIVRATSEQGYLTAEV